MPFMHTMPNMHTMPFSETTQCQLCAQCQICSTFGIVRVHIWHCVAAYLALCDVILYMHRLTSEGAGTQIFKGIANFSMCFEKFGTLSSKWAMGKASSFNIVRTTGRYFFRRGAHEKLQKNQWKVPNFQIQCFYNGTPGALCWKRPKTPKLEKLKRKLLKKRKDMNYIGWYHVKSDVLRIPKML